jgi:hypothetical protein
MAQLEVVLPALRQGRSVRRDEWEPLVRMFVLKDALMCQSGNSDPWHHSLTWGELIASDWQLFHHQAAAEQRDRASVLTLPTPGAKDWALFNVFGGEGPRYGRALTRSVTKWWNSK